MTAVEKLEKEVQNLSPSELADFRKWFTAYDAKSWDREIEDDIRKGNLDGVAAESLTAYFARKTRGRESCPQAHSRH